MDKMKPGESTRGKRPAGGRMDYEYLCTRVIMTFFKVLGLGPWTVIQRSSGRKVLNNDVSRSWTTTQLTYSMIGTLYHVFLSFVTIVVAALALPDVYRMNYAYKSQMTVAIELIQAIITNLVVVTIRILFCVKQNTVVKLFNHFASINRTIVSLGADRQSPRINRSFVIVLFLTNVLIWIVVTITESQCYEHRSLADLINEIVPTFIVNWFVMQYVIVVNLIETRFRALNRAILDSSRPPIPQPIQSLINGESVANNFGRFSPKIVTFRRTHIVLYEIACDVSEFYSLPILMTTALMSYAVIYNAYYLLMPVIMQTEFSLICVIVNATSCLAAMMLPIVMLAAGVNRTTAEMRKTADAVHKLLARSTTSREDNTELQQFSLELLQRNVQFTAYGLFPLDCTLVHSIFSMVVTYLIILFQFQLAGGKNDLKAVEGNNSTA